MSYGCDEQLRVWPSKSADEQNLLVSNEESIVYSQAIHYANRMVYLRVPLDATKKIRESTTGMEGESVSSMVTNRSLTTSVCSSLIVLVFVYSCVLRLNIWFTFFVCFRL